MNKERILRGSTSTGANISFRALIITLVLIPLNYYWMIIGEMELGGGSYMLPSFVVPFYNVIFCLFITVGINHILRRMFKISALNQGELLTIYILLSAACSLSSINMMGTLIPSMSHAFWFATPENEWNDLFMRYIPGWLTVSENNVLEGYYNGGSSLYKLENIKAWIIPALTWCAFLIVLIFVMLCINTLLRKQWNDKERLSYPIAQLPFQMTSIKENLFAEKLVWIGFAIAGSITLLNGLSFLYPKIPNLPVYRRSIAYLFPDKPFNAIGRDGFNISLYPFALGLSFLMPLDLAFSCWFFYLLGKMELVAGTITGWIASPGFPYSGDRAFGASLCLLIFLIWVGKRHLKDILFRVLNNENDNEALSYRTAFLGIIFGAGFLVLFSTRMGMSVWLAIVFFLLYFIISIMVTRMRAELGVYSHPMWGIMVPDILLKFTGTRTLGNENLTSIALFHWFNSGFSSHQMPHQMEGIRLAERANIDKKKLSIGIIFITIFGAITLFWTHLHIFYKVGALMGGGWARNGGWNTFNPLQNWMAYPRKTDSVSIAFMGVGFITSGFLSVMRLRFIWWVFHPIGYIVANLQWAMRNFWSCMLIGSTAKWLILKYGGPKAYRKTVKLCAGLILGDFVIGGVWNLIGLLFSVPTYSFWPGSYLP